MVSEHDAGYPVAGDREQGGVPNVVVVHEVICMKLLNAIRNYNKMSMLSILQLWIPAPSTMIRTGFTEMTAENLFVRCTKLPHFLGTDRR